MDTIITKTSTIPRYQHKTNSDILISSKALLITNTPSVIYDHATKTLKSEIDIYISYLLLGKIKNLETIKILLYKGNHFNNFIDQIPLDNNIVSKNTTLCINGLEVVFGDYIKLHTEGEIVTVAIDIESSASFKH